MLTIIAIILLFLTPLIYFVNFVFADSPTLAKYAGGRAIQYDRVMEKKKKREKQFNIQALIDTARILNTEFISELISHAETCMEFTQIPRSVKYQTARNVMRSSLHNGQLKLLLSEIQFLTYVMPNYTDKAYVVYAGSAPSHKLGILITLFPQVTFILVDPNEHLIMFPTYNTEHPNMTQYDDTGSKNVTGCCYFACAGGNRFGIHGREVDFYTAGGYKKLPRDQVSGTSSNHENAKAPPITEFAEFITKQTHRVYIYEDLFTDSLAQELSKLGGAPVYFISDIRTMAESGYPDNANIIWNSAMHYNWIKILQPAKFMLKFHPPYPGEPVNILPYMKADIDKCPVDLSPTAIRWEYLKAEKLFMQAYAPQSSTEARLIGSGLETQIYDPTEYEDRFYYYNMYHRTVGNHKSHTEYIDFGLGIDRCGDCAIMCGIVSAYMRKYTMSSSRDSVLSFVKNTLGSIDRKLITQQALHAINDLTGMQYVVPMDIVKRAFLVQASRQFKTKYRRFDIPAAIENQRYKLGIRDGLAKIVNGAELSGDSQLSTPAQIIKSILVSISTYDIYGPGNEFTIDLSNKIMLVFKDYENILAQIIRLVKDCERVGNTLPLPSVTADTCRGLPVETVQLCQLAKFGATAHRESIRNLELDALLRESLATYGCDGIVELCVCRTDSYTDYMDPIQPSVIHCFFGGVPIVLDDVHKNKIILINLHNVSLMMVLAVYRHTMTHNNTPIIVISRWNYINGHGRLLTDTGCGVDCKRTLCSHLFINMVNMPFHIM